MAAVGTVSLRHVPTTPACVLIGSLRNSLIRGERVITLSFPAAVGNTSIGLSVCLVKDGLTLWSVHEEELYMSQIK